jgi:hypothetical protein
VEPWYLICKASRSRPSSSGSTGGSSTSTASPRRVPPIVAANHISYLDPFANGYAVMKAGRRPRFLAKDDLFKIPVVGSAIRGAGQIPSIAAPAAPRRSSRPRRHSRTARSW